MYAQIYIFENGTPIDLSEYSVQELDSISSSISILTDMYSVDMYYGHIYDLSCSFYERFKDPYKRHRIYPPQGWAGVALEVSFQIMYDDEDEYEPEEED